MRPITTFLILAVWVAPCLAEDGLPEGFHSLGTPTADKREEARGICELRIWRDRLYLGHGDYGVNTGATDVIYFDLSEKDFHTEFTVQDEAIVRYCEVEGRLVIPGVDATESWDFGNVYVKHDADSPWIKHRKLPRAVHVFDVAAYKGDWYAATGIAEPDKAKGAPAGVFRSPDKGSRWRRVYHTPFDNTRVARLSQFLVRSGKLWAFPYAYTKKLLTNPFGTGDTLTFDGKTWTFENLFDRPLLRVIDAVDLDRAALVMAIHPPSGDDPAGRAKGVFYAWDDEGMKAIPVDPGTLLDLEVCQGQALALCRHGDERCLLITGNAMDFEQVALPRGIAFESLWWQGDAIFLGTEDGRLLFASLSELRKR